VHFQDQQTGKGAGAHPEVHLNAFQSQAGELFGPELVGLAEIQIQGGLPLEVDGHQIPAQALVFGGVLHQDFAVFQVFLQIEDLTDFFFPDAGGHPWHGHLFR
jgi:hypothetical protein